MEITARRALSVGPETAFAFLSRPHNHRRLATSRVQLRELHVTGAGTTVAILTATVTRLAAAERVLLAIGGRTWVQRLFMATLERLARELCEAPGRICAPRRHVGQAWRLPALIGADPRWR